MSDSPAQPNPSERESEVDVDAQVEAELAKASGDLSVEQMMEQAADTADAQPADKDNPAENPHVELKRGRIAAVQGDDVFVELSGVPGKNQGVVPLTQFERPPRIGSIMDFVVDRFNDDEGFYILSREGAVGRATWDHLHVGSAVEARVTSTNKGGLELELVGRIRAFMPASQVDLHHIDDLESLVGQMLQAVVQELDKRSKRVLLSRRRFLELERESKRRKLWAELEVDQVREGVVSSVMNYGAFVDLGGSDGLVHVSDLSYTHVTDPKKVVKVGDRVQVKVLKLDPEKQRISLGLKQVAPDPWETAAEQFKVGETVTGRIVRVADFGAFAEVSPGIEGLVPVSELSWKRVHKPSDVVKAGDVLRLSVLSVDPAKRRISLSLKQAAGDPWVGAERKFAQHTNVEGTVLSITDFGAFVELETGVEGLVHISELSDKHVDKVEDVLKVGDRKTFRVLEVDEGERRMRLSLKAASQPEGAPVATSSPSKPAPEGQAPRGGKAKKPRKDLKGGMGQSGALGMGLGDLKL